VVWLAFPLVYGIWTLVHGARSGFWPYPFLDVGALGWSPVLVHMAAMSALFLGLGLVLVLIDHLLGRLRRRQRR
jgi:hypothetical protein